MFAPLQKIYGLVPISVGDPGFPRWEEPTPEFWGKNPLFGQIFVEKYMKMKILTKGRGSLRPLGSANVFRKGALQTVTPGVEGHLSTQEETRTSVYHSIWQN